MLLPAGIRLHIFLVISLLGGEVSSFLSQSTNTHDRSVEISCGRNAYLKQISSVHDETYEGREWSLSCHQSPPDIRIRDCFWSGYVHDHGETFIYLCPGDTIVNGLRSVYTNYNGDRRWNVQCCLIRRRRRNDCYFTQYINELNSPFGFTVPPGRFIHGIHSIYDAGARDRVYAYDVCQFV
ncbi:dermatopontin-like [Pecten maximus]|uniref:dermatopontin-like n=1 Tax=Pecten maximus TaxID=6579 RepID=UPI001458A68B|nr:dermatopontin-like [Pecten maximus]